MDFELSDDQLALRDGARELLDGLAPTTRVRTVVDAGGGVDHGLWKAMVEQGWTAVEVPEDRGGLGLGAVEVSVLVEEIGREPEAAEPDRKPDPGEPEVVLRAAERDRVGGIVLLEEAVDERVDGSGARVRCGSHRRHPFERIDRRATVGPPR